MSKQVLILGSSGRIGSSIAADLLAYTSAHVILAGRKPEAGLKVNQMFARERGAIVKRCQFLLLNLENQICLQKAISDSDLVIHCAGPFHKRNASVLNQCIELGVNYVDVSDHPSFTCKAIALRAKAEAAGITAIVNTGVFPGISNSMVRRDIEQLDQANAVHLSYVVGGSGGAGVTTMRSMFLGLQRPFEAWTNGERQTIQPYSDREVLSFPHYGRVGVYWFDMPESFTAVPCHIPATSLMKNGTSSNLGCSKSFLQRNGHALSSGAIGISSMASSIASRMDAIGKTYPKTSHPTRPSTGITNSGKMQEF